jgi:signal transduction histidine kinase
MNIVCFQNIDKEKQLINAFSESNYEDLVQIANGIAHELRNPLMGIGGFVNRLLKSSRAIQDHEKYYGYIVNNLKKIEELVRKVEFFASLPKPSFAEESVRKLLDEALQPFLQQIEEREIELTISMEEMILRVDKDLATRLFSILIENALDALSKGGKILIRSETNDIQGKIYVSDTGSGISPKDIPHIFKPFFSTKADGAGIDLATAKRIMGAHGGRIEVRSELGEGTSFILLFPLERRHPLRSSRLED